MRSHPDCRVTLLFTDQQTDRPSPGGLPRWLEDSILKSQTHVVTRSPMQAEAPVRYMDWLGRAPLFQRHKQFHARLHGCCQKHKAMAGKTKDRKMLRDFNNMPEHARETPVLQNSTPHTAEPLPAPCSGRWALAVRPSDVAKGAPPVIGGWGNKRCFVWGPVQLAHHYQGIGVRLTSESKYHRLAQTISS